MGTVSTSANVRVRQRLAVGGSSSTYVLATGGTVTTDTASLVEHTFTAGGTFALINNGLLPVAFTITGTGTFGGVGTSGTTNVTGNVTVTVTSGSVVVAYDPTDWERGHPLGIPGIDAYWTTDDSSTITHTGNAVDTFTDLVASNVLAGSGGTRPTTNTVTQNSLNIIDYAADYLDDTTFTTDVWTNRAATIIWVASDAWSSGIQSMWMVTPASLVGGNEYTGIICQRIASTDIQVTQGNFSGGGAGTDYAAFKWTLTQSSTVKVFTARVDTSTVTLRCNSVALSRSTDGGTMSQANFASGSPTTMAVGVARRGHSSGNYPKTGKVGPFIVVPSYMSDAEVAATEAWLTAKWGL